MNWTQHLSGAVVCHNTIISRKNMPGAFQCGSARFDGSEVSEPAISNAVQGRRAFQRTGKEREKSFPSSSGISLRVSLTGLEL